jgi:hypothetical protein
LKTSSSSFFKKKTFQTSTDMATLESKILEEEQAALKAKMEASLLPSPTSVSSPSSSSFSSSVTQTRSIPNLKSQSLLDDRLTPPPHPHSHVLARQTLSETGEAPKRLAMSLDLPRKPSRGQLERLRQRQQQEKEISQPESHGYEFLFESEDEVQDVLLHHLLSASARGRLEIVDHILSSHPVDKNPTSSSSTTTPMPTIPTIPLRRFAALKVQLTVSPSELINRQDYDGKYTSSLIFILLSPLSSPLVSSPPPSSLPLLSPPSRHFSSPYVFFIFSS